MAGKSSSKKSVKKNNKAVKGQKNKTTKKKYASSKKTKKSQKKEIPKDFIPKDYLKEDVSMTEYEEEHILKPTIEKVLLTLFISFIAVGGWMFVVKMERIELAILLLYIGFTAIWIMVSVFGSCLLVHLAGKNRITRLTAFLIVTAITVIFGSMLFLILR